MKKIIALIFLLLAGALNTLFSQTSRERLMFFLPTYTNIIQTKDGYLVPNMIIDGDTVPVIKIRPVVIFPPRKFKNKREWRRYTRLEYNVRKVYPYAKLIHYYYYEIQQELQYIPPDQQKAYLKQKEKELRKKFEKDLINLTITQGRILIKLVDRETGYTTYEVIEQFKGKMAAVFWQSIARLFGDNLKSEYDPEEEDRLIEEIIAKIENGQ